MRKTKSSLIPMRGSVEDWGPGKYQRNLERKEAYARRMREQASRGQPDFDKLLTLGAPPPEKRAAAKKAPSTKKKSTKKAKKTSKKSGKKKRSR